MLMLDGTIPIWLLGLLCFALGTVLGTMATWLLVARHDRTRQLQAELDELRQGSQEYRDQVTRHFMRTSELVQEMARSYREVYEHLASGAQALCGEESKTEHLQQQDVVKLDDTAGEAGFEYSGEDGDIEAMLGDTPRISDLDIRTGTKSKNPLRH